MWLLLLLAVPGQASELSCVRSELLDLFRQRSVFLADERAIADYYVDIDSGDLNAVLELFAEGATYKRGNAFNLVGKDAIRSFYLNQRKLKGKHEIRDVRRQGRFVVVDGVFKGTHEDAPIEVNFRDYWELDGSGRVTRRESVLDVDGV